MASSSATTRPSGDQQIEVAEHLGEGQERLRERDVAPHLPREP